MVWLGRVNRGLIYPSVILENDPNFISLTLAGHSFIPYVSTFLAVSSNPASASAGLSPLHHKKSFNSSFLIHDIEFEQDRFSKQYINNMNKILKQV